MVFEYLDHDLAGILDHCYKAGAPLPPAQIKYYLHCVLVAVAECHARGVIHRDVKGAPPRLPACLPAIVGSGALSPCACLLGARLQHPHWQRRRCQAGGLGPGAARHPRRARGARAGRRQDQPRRDALVRAGCAALLSTHAHAPGLQVPSARAAAGLHELR